MLAPPKGGNFAPTGHFCPERPHITALAVVAAFDRKISHGGLQVGTSCAPFIVCRDKLNAQLFGTCLRPLPFQGLRRLLHLALVTEAEGILYWQDGIPETAVALETVPGDDLRPLCSDKTMFLQCSNVLRHRVDRDAQLLCDGGVADNALISAAVLDAEEVA